MNEQTEVTLVEAEAKPAPPANIVEYLQSEQSMSLFASAAGEHQAKRRVMEVISLWRENVQLQECTWPSIRKAAIDACVLNLSLARREAYMVPYRNRREGTVEAAFQPGYMGKKVMASRTGKYRRINVYDISLGQTFVEDPITGAGKIIDLEHCPKCDPNQQNDQFILEKKRCPNCNTRYPTNPRSGILGVFEMLPARGHQGPGLTKMVFWTIEEIHAHKEKFSKGWKRPDSPWKTNPERMEDKTVYHDLLKGAYMGDDEDRMLQALAAEQESLGVNDFDDGYDEVQEELPEMDGTIIEPEPERKRQTESEAMKDLGFDVETEKQPTSLVEKLRQDAKRNFQQGNHIKPGQLRALISTLNENLGDDYRHMLGDLLFGITSTKQWNPANQLAVWKFLGVKKDESTGEWLPNFNNVQLLRELCIEEEKARGQLELEGAHE